MRHKTQKVVYEMHKVCKFGTTDHCFFLIHTNGIFKLPFLMINYQFSVFRRKTKRLGVPQPKHFLFMPHPFTDRRRTDRTAVYSRRSYSVIQPANINAPPGACHSICPPNVGRQGRAEFDSPSLENSICCN